MFHLTRADFPAEQDSSAFAKLSVGVEDLIEKAGARKSKADMETIQAAHDTMAKLAEGAHCSGMDKGAFAEELAKRGARHSASDMATIKVAHDSMVKLGAACGKAE